MRFSELAWASMLFYYRAAGDKRYSSVMSDHLFLQRLRQAPSEITVKEFEEKAILTLVNMENYDLLLGHHLADQLLRRVVSLVELTKALKTQTLASCDLDDPETLDAINHTYAALYVEGLWITGVSKIAHLLNEKLFPPLSPDIARHFSILSQDSDLKPWLKTMQEDIREAKADFHSHGLGEAPEEFLSQKLGYTAAGFTKPMVKFADEYYWLRHIDGMSIPPVWVPSFS
jgi:hypothetical protein